MHACEKIAPANNCRRISSRKKPPHPFQKRVLPKEKERDATENRQLQISKRRKISAQDPTPCPCAAMRGLAAVVRPGAASRPLCGTKAGNVQEA